MIGWTLCSGIGAPEIAAPWVDWRLASEIEPFPRAVLEQRLGYVAPPDHNQGQPLLWGDMTEVSPDLALRHGAPLPDILVAGTPCQAFSIAGLRKGTEDPRGNLTLKFVETCHAIADAKPDGRLAVLWENVPGVLSDRTNAFGALLAGLVGALEPLPRPAGSGSKSKSWPREGMVEGPRARAAWAVLDAQWFGVAQRRRRVFLVVDFGTCVDPAAVLLEPESLRGDTPPRRETGKAAPTIPSRSTAGGGLGTDFDLDGGLVAHTLKGDGFDASEDGTGRGTPLVPVAFDCKGTEVQFADDGTHPTLRSMGHSNSHQNAGGHAAVAFAIQERAISENPNAGPDGAGVRSDDAAYTIEARTTTQAVAFDLRGRDGGSLPEGPHETANVRAASGGSSRSYIAQPYAVRRLTPTECARLQGFPDHHARIAWRGKPPEDCPDGPQYKAYGNSMAVPVIRYVLERVGASMEFLS